MDTGVSPTPAGGRRGGALLLLGVALIAGLVGGGAVAVVDRTGGTTRTVAPVTTVTTPTPASAVALRKGSQSRSINGIYRQDGPGVVSVTAVSDPQTQSSSPGLTPPANPATSRGSGFVLDGDGYIVTNDHVVERDDRVTVSFSNRDEVPARIVGLDPTTDLALLKVDLPASALHPLVLGNSDQAQVGDPVVAIGNPFGLDRTVTAGIVSAKQRAITAPSGYLIANAIQTDAPLGRRSSGGPLIDERGAVIGINASPLVGTGLGSDAGVGFAIPVNVAKQVIAQMRFTGTVQHARLGVDGADVNVGLAQSARVAASSGVLVEAVAPGSPAAGVRLSTGSKAAVFNGTTYCLGGDVITDVDGRAL